MSKEKPNSAWLTVLYALVMSPVVLCGMAVGFLWGAFMVGYWFADDWVLNIAKSPDLRKRAKEQAE